MHITHLQRQSFRFQWFFFAFFSVGVFVDAGGTYEQAFYVSGSSFSLQKRKNCLEICSLMIILYLVHVKVKETTFTHIIVIIYVKYPCK